MKLLFKILVFVDFKILSFFFIDFETNILNYYMYWSVEYMFILMFSILSFFLTVLLFFVSFCFLTKSMTFEKGSPFECGFEPFEGDVPHHSITKVIFCFIFCIIAYIGVIFILFHGLNILYLHNLSLVPLPRLQEMTGKVNIEEIISVKLDLESTIRPWSSYIIPTIGATITIGLLFPALPGAIVGLIWGVSSSVSHVVVAKTMVPLVAVAKVCIPCSVPVASVLVFGPAAYDVPISFNPMASICFNLLQAGQWTHSLDWFANEWPVYFAISSCFTGLYNIFIACRLSPLFLQLPEFCSLVYFLDGHFRLFWDLAATVHYTFGDPVGEELRMVGVGRDIVKLVNRLCCITDVSIFHKLQWELWYL